MAWVRIHDGALSHPKIGGLVDLGHPFDLWVWGLTHCQMHLTDGFIVSDLLPKPALKAATELVRRGLWETHDLGWKVHDYLTWNDCREVVLERQAKAKERKEAWKDKQKQVRAERRTERVPNTLALSPNQTKPNQTKEEQEKKEICAELHADVPSALTFLRFPVIGPLGPEWALSEAQVAEWVRLFPGHDVHGECRKALAWTQANPGRRKTARGMAKFLVGWLSRAVDRGGASMPMLGAPLVQNKRIAGLATGTQAFLNRRQG